jgi:hypothetical protein
VCGDYLTLDFFLHFNSSVVTNYSKGNQQKGQSTPNPPKSAAGKIENNQINMTFTQKIEGILEGQNPKVNGFVSSSLPSKFL